MNHRINAEERAAFRGCRRRWDLASPNRMNLERHEPRPVADLQLAIGEALAIYYFPGMWDWPRPIVLPLVIKAFDRSLDEQRARRTSAAPLSGADQDAWAQGLERGHDMLDRYLSWAPSADHFGPILVEAEFEVQVADPVDPEAGLATADGRGIRYYGKVSGLVIDEYDAYWVLRHRVVDDWADTEQLLLDEESLAACWSWENFYLGMTIAGTIDNELRVDPGTASAAVDGGTQVRRVGQHDPSGGGRSIPQHRRIWAQAREPDVAPRVEVQAGPGLRRTWIRRSRAEKAAAATRLSMESLAMADPSTPAYPSPSPEQCGPCPFVQPCLALSAGGDWRATLADAYRARAEAPENRGRIGAVTWSVGRGAAPPRFGDDR